MTDCETLGAELKPQSENPMHVVLVCGDRLWGHRTLPDGKPDLVASAAEVEALYNTLDELHSERPITRLVEGEARGADIMAREWAESRGILVDPYPAEWHKYGRSAGPRRNTQMLVEGQPNLVVAFHPNIALSKGTANMLRQARDAGIDCEWYNGRGDKVLL